MSSQTPESPILSVHIHKTGGTSLRKFWPDLYGPSSVLFYYANKGGLYCASEDRGIHQTHPWLYQIRNIMLQKESGKILYRILRGSVQQNMHILSECDIPDNCRVIHGHFTPDHFAKIVPNARLVTVLREPWERILSAYRFLSLTTKVNGHMPPGWKEGMSFRDFALMPEQTNSQYKALNGFQLSDFYAVGVTHQLRNFCDCFDPSRSAPVGKLNPTTGEVEGATIEVENQFRAQNYLDYELYSQAIARSQALPLSPEL